jgi:internalin A
MNARRKRGAALGLGAGLLALLLFFSPFFVLTLGAKVLTSRMTTTHAPVPMPVEIPPPAASSKLGRTNNCNASTCDLYDLDDEARALLAAPENRSKKLVVVEPTAEMLAWVSTQAWIQKLELSSIKGIDDLTPVGSLEGLEDLKVSNAKMTTLAPLEKLVHLERLNLVNSSLLTDIGALAVLPNLKDLQFFANQVRDLGPVGAASQLRTLTIRNVSAPLDPLARLGSLEQLEVDAKGDLWPLSTLTGLRSLSLWGGRVSEPAPLGKLVGLQSLDVSSAHVSTVDFASTLRQLKNIDLDYDRDLKDLKPLRGLPALTDVEAAETAIDDLTPLATCPHLARLKVDKTKITTLSPLSHATELASLSLAGTAVKDLMPIAKLPALKTVTVGTGQIPDAAMAAFKVAAPAVRVTIVK